MPERVPSIMPASFAFARSVRTTPELVDEHEAGWRDVVQAVRALLHLLAYVCAHVNCRCTHGSIASD